MWVSDKTNGRSVRYRSDIPISHSFDLERPVFLSNFVEGMVQDLQESEDLTWFSVNAHHEEVSVVPLALLYPSNGRQ